VAWEEEERRILSDLRLQDAHVRVDGRSFVPGAAFEGRDFSWTTAAPSVRMGR
jgi:hypothetical protein